MGDKAQRIKDRISDLDVGQTTRLAALAALILSVVASIISGFILWSLWWNVTALRQAKLVPFLDARFDALAAASAVGRLDVLSMLLTFAGVIAAVSLVYGLTAFRTAATKAAIEEMGRQLPLELSEMMEKQGHTLIAAALKDDELIARLSARFTSLGLDDIDDAEEIDTDAEWKEDGNGK